MPLLIREIPSTDAPVALLLLADPSEDKVRSYLPGSRCFIASSGGDIVGACVVLPLGAGAYELMNIAVEPGQQRSGHGTALLKWVIGFFRRSGASRIEVGTGTFGYQLAFYQRLGFRVAGIDHGFFVNNYAEPVFEDGIQHFDMLRLVFRYADDAAPAPGDSAGSEFPTAEDYAAERAGFAALQVVDLHILQQDVAGGYRNQVVLDANDHCMRISIFEGVYRWHFHPDTDELFLVLAGELHVELDGGGDAVLHQGQCLVVPAGTVHRTRAVGRTVNVTFEKQGTETRFVDRV